ncbi:histone-lysine N-methyltransferase SMYD3-like [Asterias amurensis]|uniref:histone-lysine N-methyltransferase SMYD3-like n=1 Tax=Asterias amurensis TaxID=7602 RepID=UPI003AB4EBA8
MASELEADCEKVEIFFQENRGRGVRATTIIEPGTILCQEDPYVFVLDGKERKNRCSFCFQKREKLKKCGGCNYVSYCDRQCQSSNYANHQYECKFLKGAECDVQLRTRLLLMCLQKQLKRSKKNSVFNSQGFPLRPEGLYEKKEEDHEKETSDQGPDMEFLLVFLSGLKGVDIGTESVYRCLRLLNANTFSIYDETIWKGVGEGLFTRLAMFNHDCRPNCTFVFDGVRLSVRSLKSISPGEECVISYLNLMKPAAARQNTLRIWYDFECDCKRCTQGSNKDRLMYAIKCPQMNCLGTVVPCQPGIVMNEDFEGCDACGFDISTSNLPDKIKEAEEKVKSFWDANHGNDALFLDGCGPLVSLLDSVYQPHHMSVYNLNKGAFNAALRTFHDAEHEMTLKYGLRSVCALRTQLDDCDAYMCYTLWRVGQLQAQLGLSSKAIHTLEKVLTSMRIAYGSNHKVTLKAEELLVTLKAGKDDSGIDNTVTQEESNLSY